MKFLIKDIGRDEFLRLVDEEKKALSYQSYEIDTTDFDVAIPATLLEVPKLSKILRHTKLGNNQM
jgi:sulfite reductase (ferredoxin)